MNFDSNSHIINESKCLNQIICWDKKHDQRLIDYLTIIDKFKAHYILLLLKPLDHSIKKRWYNEIQFEIFSLEKNKLVIFIENKDNTKEHCSEAIYIKYDVVDSFLLYKIKMELVKIFKRYEILTYHIRYALCKQKHTD